MTITKPNDGRRRDNLPREKRVEIGKKGGATVSRNRTHMAEIGRKGGIATSQDREHMAKIGSLGGKA